MQTDLKLRTSSIEISSGTSLYFSLLEYFIKRVWSQKKNAYLTYSSDSTDNGLIMKMTA